MFLNLDTMVAEKDALGKSPIVIGSLRVEVSKLIASAARHGHSDLPSFIATEAASLDFLNLDTTVAEKDALGKSPIVIGSLRVEVSKLIASAARHGHSDLPKFHRH